MSLYENCKCLRECPGPYTSRVRLEELLGPGARDWVLRRETGASCRPLSVTLTPSALVLMGCREVAAGEQ